MQVQTMGPLPVERASHAHAQALPATQAAAAVPYTLSVPARPREHVRVQAAAAQHAAVARAVPLGAK